MRKIKLPTDRTVFSTDNNGYAGNERDETLVDQNLWDSEIAADDRIPDGIGEIGEDDRPVNRSRTTASAASPHRAVPFPEHPARTRTIPTLPTEAPVLHIPCAFFQPAIKYFTARHVSMSEFGNEGICP